ncbi:unnamed protein product, partial [Sphenostylis stenocarpa]
IIVGCVYKTNKMIGREANLVLQPHSPPLCLPNYVAAKWSTAPIILSFYALMDST